MRLTRRESIGAALAAPLAAAAPASAADPDRERALRAVRTAVAGEQTTAVAIEAIANSDLVGDDAVEALRVMLDHARAHVAALEKLFKAQSGQDPPLPPTRTAIDGLDGLRGRRDALRMALRLEEEAVAAHLDAIRLYRNPLMLRLVAGAMGTDAQHLVVLRSLLGEEPVPEPFERGA